MRSRVFSVGGLILCGVLLVCAGCGGDSGKSKGKGSVADRLTKAHKLEDPDQRARELLKIAAEQKKASDLGAESTYKAAGEAADQVEDPKGKATLLNSVADAFAKADMITEAKSTLKKVQQAIDKIEEREAKLPLLIKLAVISGGKQMGNKDAAAGYLKTCEELADGFEAIDVKTVALLDVAVAYGKIDLPAETQRLIDKSFEQARGAADKRKRTDSLSEIGGRLAGMKKADEAKAAFKEADESAADIETDDSRAYALALLADKQIAAGLKPAALDTLAKAGKLADKVKDSSVGEPLREKISVLKNKAS